MASMNEAVQRLTIESRLVGVDESTRGVRQLGQAQNDLVTVSQRVETATGRMEQALLRSQKAIDANNQITKQMTTANDNLAHSWQAANDNARSASEGFHITAMEALKAANYVTKAAEAAYILSPAFRNLVNPIVATTLRAAGVAAASLGGIFASILGPAVVSAAGSFIATLGPAVLAAAGFLSRILFPIFLVVEGVKLLSAIFELGADKIKEFNKLAADAFAAGVSTDFFQRQTVSAKEMGIEVDKVAEALKKFNDVSMPVLGGSVLQKRLDELTKAGNFKGNPGVAEFKNANDTEGRYRAVEHLITVAIDKGERLAALDLASKFLPPELLNRLRETGNILTVMQQHADAIKPVDLAQQKDIDRAIELKKRYDDAWATITSTKIIQDLLTGTGIAFQAIWVSIIELIASAVEKLGQLFQFIADHTSGAPSGESLEVLRRMGLAVPAPAEQGPPQSLSTFAAFNARTGKAIDAATAQDAARLAARRAADARPDTSHPIETDTGAFSKLEASLLRQAAAEEAKSKAIGKSVGETARLNAEFRLLEAAQQDIFKNKSGSLDDYADRIKKIADRLGAAAQNAAELKLQNDLVFERSQIGRTSDDQQIASALRGVYGNDYEKELNGAVAAQMRLNQQLQFTHDLGQEAFKGFLSDLRKGVSASQAFANAVTGMLDKVISKLEDMAFNGLWNAAFGGAGGGVTAGITGGALRGGLFGGTLIPGILHEGGLGMNAPSSGRYVHPAYFDSAPRFHEGKLPWDPSFEMPAILDKREEVLTTDDPRHVWNGGKSGGGGQNTTIIQHIHVDGATGNSEVRQMVAEGVGQANRQSAALLKHYDANVLPARIPEISQRMY